jgi:protoporphyrinogen oxidase
MQKITILGAGAAGLSCSFHLGHENCIIFERNNFFGGHIYSHQREGFTWDEGPHVSFTENCYVKELFEESVKKDFLEFEVNIGNYYKGNWIPHPAQANFWAIPENIRKACLEDFINSRKNFKNKKKPTNYADWLEQAFGKTFAETFPTIYTNKYWTCHPSNLATDWIGKRVFYPEIETVLKGYDSKPEQSSHYVRKVRYPSRGGYIRFMDKLSHNSNIQLNFEVKQIDLKEKIIFFTNGKHHKYDKLICTLPLDELVKLSINAPSEILKSAENLQCSSVLLINITAKQTTLKPYHWLYVYDENKLSTRINHINLLSPNNVQVDRIGIQVEVYTSRYRPFTISHKEIANLVAEELKEIGLIENKPETVHTHFVPYANVIFDHNRKESQDCILTWLEKFGLVRENDDLDPITDWKKKHLANLGNITLAGRFAEWKYHWSDDCVLRGKFIGENSKF